MSEDRPLEGRIVVVTGASRGIGYEAAKGFAAAGAHIVAVARTVGGLEELDDEIKALGGSATLVPLDLKDSEGIDRLGAAIYERWKKLDVLFANAGLLGRLSPVAHVPPEIWDDVFAVNVTANYRLIRSLDPLLRQSDAGRALFMTSGITRTCRPFWGPYAASKAALDAMARTYAQEVEKTSIRVVVIAPGPLRTGMRAQAMPGEDPETLPDPAEIVPYLVEMASPRFQRTNLLFDFPTRTYEEWPGAS